MAHRIKPQLTVLTNDDPQFYRILGPYLARRDVHKQIGGVPWDDDTKTWYVMRDHGASGRPVLGFVAVAAHASRTTVESLYLADPAHKRIASELVGLAVDRHPATDLHTVVRREAVYAYTDNGFTLTGETKDFVRLTRKATAQ